MEAEAVIALAAKELSIAEIRERFTLKVLPDGCAVFVLMLTFCLSSIE